jgi:UDP-N-acetylmuramoylalanine--D-glutamate ligase
MVKIIVEELKKKFFNKKVLIVGLGVLGGGVGLAKFFSKLGARVIITDLRSQEILKDSIKELVGLNCQYYFGDHPQEIFLNADHIFIGPSVCWDLPQLQAAIKKGIPVEMEASFFLRHCPAKIIGITGTRGKSTTAMMIYEILKQQKKSVFLGGNFSGLSTIALLEKVDKESFVILELSSWQLSSFHRKKISPSIAVFTNFYPDHLNYYASLNNYFYDKKALYQYQTQDDYLIINYQLKNYLKRNPSKSHLIYFSKDNFLDKFKYLRGDHNRENAAASLLVAKVLKLNQEKARQTIINFKGIDYRQEVIGKKNQVFFVNDTTSTTPIATIKAIDSFSDKPIVLILGGNDKNLPVDKLLKQLTKVKSIVLLKGSFTDKIYHRLQKSFPEKISPIFTNLEEAVDFAYQQALNESLENYLLFSPGATSFAMFKNEFDRGRAFNLIVKRILND